MNSQELSTGVGVETKKEMALQASSDNSTLSKKDLALITAGATREASYAAMVSGLTAETMSLDKFGNEHTSPDHPSRLRAAELISKLNGDLKESPITNNVSVTMTITPSDLALFTLIVTGMKEEIMNLRASGRQTGEVIDV